MIRVWHGMWIGEDGHERPCLITQVLDGPERAIDADTGDPVTGPFYKTSD